MERKRVGRRRLARNLLGPLLERFAALQLSWQRQALRMTQSSVQRPDTPLSIAWRSVSKKRCESTSGREQHSQSNTLRPPGRRCASAQTPKAMCAGVCARTGSCRRRNAQSNPSSRAPPQRSRGRCARSPRCRPPSPVGLKSAAFVVQTLSVPCLCIHVAVVLVELVELVARNALCGSRGRQTPGNNTHGERAHQVFNPCLVIHLPAQALFSVPEHAPAGRQRTASQGRRARCRRAAVPETSRRRTAERRACERKTHQRLPRNSPGRQGSCPGAGEGTLRGMPS